jgi:hypothetical protein
VPIQEIERNFRRIVSEYLDRNNIATSIFTGWSGLTPPITALGVAAMDFDLKHRNARRGDLLFDIGQELFASFGLPSNSKAATLTVTLERPSSVTWQSVFSNGDLSRCVVQIRLSDELLRHLGNLSKAEMAVVVKEFDEETMRTLLFAE